MNVLHIVNSYGGTDVYTNLYTSIDLNANITQRVYVPLNNRNHDRVGKKMIDFKNRESNIHYATVLKGYHKYLYGSKISTIVKDIERTIELDKVDVIHAGMMCLDGAAAYELHKKHGIPYIVAVRSTDIFFYYRKLFWRKSYFTKILLNAEKIVFISPKYKELFLENYVPKNYLSLIEQKMLVMPNGVNEYFLKNRNLDEHKLTEDFRLIFVSGFFARKGLVETINAVERLRSKGLHISVNAIGKGLPDRPLEQEYIRKVEELSNGKTWVKLQPFKKADEVMREMRSSDAFIMVSSNETFGLVYVEALTQGLPIIYAKNEGIDGFFPEGFVGFSAQAGNVDSIADAIEKLICEYSSLSKNVNSLDLDKDFEWNTIAKKYLELYNKILQK